MSELIEVYGMKEQLLGVMNRDSYYSEIKEEYKKTAKITKKVRAIRLLLMNSKGRIYLQKRSRDKKENPGLYDKSIGGHISKGDTWNMTVIRECAEELGFPAAIVEKTEFKKAVTVTDLSIVGIFKEIDYLPNFESVRVTKDGKEFIQPYMTKIYMGYYDGPIKFVDGESSGIEVFSLEELKEEIKNTPEKFTEDIKFMIKKYERFLKPI